MRNTASILALLAASASIGGCTTSSEDNWRGGATTPFAQAERSCREQLEFVSDEENRREIFTGCMAALGWTPREGASLEI
ncbi:hypothetical protein [Qipengyuania spongiae]|uniref:Entry exclusion lipoprotein TrbK n=1 Tax=Qipengyuania spongiae TaxID=2909673 RepID=A0ABY5SW94_9SPHN|nr:hypothetical protein [Qipengyuania spongiae]UVI38818.1 hypothetical protein L1F33_11270 [Qipengyuania spongiae]